MQNVYSDDLCITKNNTIPTENLVEVILCDLVVKPNIIGKPIDRQV